jgi:hypothetical protein
MLPREVASMQECSRGASPDWAPLREPSGDAGSQRFNGRGVETQRFKPSGVETLFPFGVDDASIANVFGIWIEKTMSSRKCDLVVDSRILTVI